MSYLLAALGFAALVILHEAGHFAAARAVGMRVERFSLFFGPMFVKLRRGETDYGIGVIPLGGYVKITGMSPREDIPPDVLPRAYYNQPVWKRVVVILAGPAVNLVIAFGIVWALFLANGETVTANKVGSIQAQSAAAGHLRLGDQLISVDGRIGNPDRLRAQISSHRCASAQTNGCQATTPARTVVRRQGRLLTFELRPRYSTSERRPLLGFIFADRQVPVSAPKAASLAVSQLWFVTKKTISAVARIFEPRVRKQLNSVVGGYAITQKSFARSTTLALWVLALISLSLAVINLFPFLPLDGGHVFWAVAEKVRRRRIPFEVMERAGLVGFALILTVFAFGLTNDIHTLSTQGFKAP